MTQSWRSLLPHAVPVGTQHLVIFLLCSRKYCSPEWQQSAASTVLVPVSFMHLCYQMLEFSRTLLR